MSDSIEEKIRQGVGLAEYSTYKIGGVADYFVEVFDIPDLLGAIEWAKKENKPYKVIGLGANVLFADEGYRGLIIINRANHFHFEGNDLVVESGAVVADLIVDTLEKGLSGFEHFIGIPSTIGGALRQNLHFLSPDRESTVFLGSILVSAKVLLEDGEIENVDREFFRFGYDDSVLHHRQIVVLEARFKLKPADKADMRKILADNMSWRIAKQPQLDEYASCGSVFKRIEDVGAGRLIDQVGLKGKTIGGARVSSRHANYLVNLGNATANDVKELIAYIQKKVKKETGYELEPEVEIFN